jgi:3-hydroxyacyl-CoA dehydrogenase
MDRLVSIERSGDAAIITMMNPPVNALSRQLADALREAFLQIDTHRIIFTGAGKLFVAGADIREIERITKQEIPPDLNYLNDLLNLIESSGRLVIMAMNGSAFGIGLELAMAGHYRILDQHASVGLPEVKLGLIPGAGGTQRLPRLVGISKALSMCISGKPINAEEAFSADLVDELSSGNLIERALQIHQGRRTDQLPCPHYESFEEWARGANPSQRSPLRVIAAIKAASEASTFQQGLLEERRIFEQALLDPQARAMVHLFFAERELAKVPYIPKGTEAAAIDSVTQDGDIWTIQAQGTCELRISPSQFGSRIFEIFWHDSMQPQCLAAALLFARKQNKLAVVVRKKWVGAEDFQSATGSTLLQEGAVLRASDLDVLMVRGYGFPEELGGPMHAAQFTTPSQTSESVREPLK